MLTFKVLDVPNPSEKHLDDFDLFAELLHRKDEEWDFEKMRDLVTKHFEISNIETASGTVIHDVLREMVRLGVIAPSDDLKAALDERPSRQELQRRAARYYAFVRGFEDTIRKRGSLKYQEQMFGGGKLTGHLVTPDVVCAYNYGRQEAAHTMQHVREFAVGAFNYHHDVRSDQ